MKWWKWLRFSPNFAFSFFSFLSQEEKNVGSFRLFLLIFMTIFYLVILSLSVKKRKNHPRHDGVVMNRRTLIKRRIIEVLLYTCIFYVFFEIERLMTQVSGDKCHFMKWQRITNAIANKIILSNGVSCHIRYTIKTIMVNCEWHKAIRT